jgi:hypothetical protein
MLAWGHRPRNPNLACDPALKARFNQVDYSLNVAPASESRFQRLWLSTCTMNLGRRPRLPLSPGAFGAQKR